ncbi:MAG: hypothetical protein R2788_13940 [Saprospiraceae bacterium]
MPIKISKLVEYLNKMGRVAAVAQQQVLAQAEELMLFLEGHGLTAAIVMEWIGRELEGMGEEGDKK